MLQSDQRARSSRRLNGAATKPDAQLPSYQDLLDEALDDTFPASDPIAIGAATRPREAKPSRRDSHDWTLEPEAPAPDSTPKRAKNKSSR